MQQLEMVDLLLDRINLRGAHLQIIQLMGIGRAARGAGKRQVKIRRQRCLTGHRRHVKPIQPTERHKACAAIALDRDQRAARDPPIHGNPIAMPRPGGAARHINTGAQVRRSTGDIAVADGARTVTGTAQRHRVWPLTGAIGSGATTFGGEVTVLIDPDPQPATRKTRSRGGTARAIAQGPAITAGLGCNAGVREHHGHTVGPAAVVGVVLKLHLHIVSCCGK